MPRENDFMETQEVQKQPPRTEPVKSSTLPQPGRPVPSRAYPGALIVVEGTDGSGKSTQLYLLKRWLEIGGYRLHFTEWNSSPLVKAATRRGKQRRLLTPTTFSLLHAADFADRCERQIMPLLQGDYLVLADRYVYTAFARDATRGVDRQCGDVDDDRPVIRVGPAIPIGLAVLLMAALTTLGVRILVHRRVGGLTGRVLSATRELVETVVLATLGLLARLMG